MDTLTHIVLGAAIGEAVLGRKIGKKALLLGAFADSIPDFDVFLNPFLNPVDALLAHRGITHSLLFALLMPLPMAMIFKRLFKRYDTNLIDWFLLFFLGFITHDLIDTMTAYGIGLFEPFSKQRFSMDNLFVADPLYTLPLLLSFIALAILKRNSTQRKKWNRFGLLASGAYIIFTLGVKTHVNATTKRSLENQGVSYIRYMTTPTPFNSLLWMIVSEDTAGFNIGYYSVFDGNDSIPYQYFPKHKTAERSIQNEQTLKKLQLFSDNYYVIVEKDSTWYLNDLRFGQVGGWYKDDAPFAFQYMLERDEDNELILEKGRWNSTTTLSEDFYNLFLRIKGD